MDSQSDIPPELLPEISHTYQMSKAFLFALSFIVHNTARDPAFSRIHLLAYLSQDLLQSIISVPVLVHEGILNVARRELRFVLEASIKLCFIQQQEYQSTISEKLTRFKTILDSASISSKKQLNLDLLHENERAPFLQELGRLYGETSNYVHLTEEQVRERIQLVEAGRTAGKEKPEDIQTVNALMERTLAATLTLIFHAVPSYVAGDFFVEPDGKTVDWFFTRSRYVASLDATFDYKHERQAALQQIQDTRASRVTF